MIGIAIAAMIMTGISINTMIITITGTIIAITEISIYMRGTVIAITDRNILGIGMIIIAVNPMMKTKTEGIKMDNRYHEEKGGEQYMKKVLFFLISVSLISVLVLYAGNGFAAEHKYVGNMKCKACHLVQYKSWEATKHAKAMEVLKDNEKKDPKCLACHTTGYGKASAEGAQMEDVQCEACHGPGSDYKSPAIKNKAKWKENAEAQKKLATEAGLIASPTKEVCEACHNKNSPTFKGFDFDKALSQVKHKK